MNFEKKMRDYASLTAKLGVNVKSDRYVYLNCDIEAAEFGRLVEEECYKLGAKDVIMNYNDQRAARIRLDNADISMFEKLPEWKCEKRKKAISWSARTSSAAM